MTAPVSTAHTPGCAPETRTGPKTPSEGHTGMLDGTVRLSRRQERVYGALVRAAAGCGGDGNRAWVCMRSLTHPKVGGNRAAARLHELRGKGVAVERRLPCVCGECRYYTLRARDRGERPAGLSAWRLAGWQQVWEQAARGAETS